ncbi:MAG: MBL fold metallo-hydrolase [Kurthia sp.]|nr:MBL fold metallo-hydrolase [Candidatus Kurthia equi]
MMELITKTTEKETADVQMIEGTVNINGVKLNVYSFLIDHTLIDSGSQTLLEDFQPWFKKQRIDQVFITHNHEDHTGGVTWLQQEKGIPVFIHPDSVEKCKSLEETPVYRQLTWGSRGAFIAQPFSVKMTSENYTWDIIETLGHTQDHLSFYCREKKILFTGDLFVLPHTKAILNSENMQDTLASLRKVLTFDFEAIYCCHAGYLKNGRAMIIEKINYLEKILAKSKDLKEQGLTIEEITAQIFPKKYAIEQFSKGEWGSKYIVNSLLNDQVSG